MALPLIYSMRSAQVAQLYQLLDSHGPATAWAALQATGSVTSFPVSVVTELGQRLRMALTSPHSGTVAQGVELQTRAERSAVLLGHNGTKEVGA